jgi:hypothetical protein
MSEKKNLKGITGFEDQETVAVSPWMLSLVGELGEDAPAPHWSYSFEEFSFEIVEATQSLWIIARFPAGCAGCTRDDLWETRTGTERRDERHP